MKVGDLVKWNAANTWATSLPQGYHGLVIEVGAWVGRNDVKILWSSGHAAAHKSHNMEVISESRRPR